jgi:Kdo2-lipid IVA lauroyltransferase/acyltransferase
MDNLRYTFPEKDDEELKTIAKRFYRNFTDNWIETIKLLSVKQKTLNKRMTGNFEVFNQLYKTGKAVQLNLGHFFNWEVMAQHNILNQPYPFLAVYLPQKSKIFDRLLKYLRGRWGISLLPSNDMVRSIIPWRKKQYLLMLIADQSPGSMDNAYWLYFLNRPAGFAKGPEKNAKSMDLPVVMLTTTKPRRGHYHFEYFLLTDDPKSLPDGEIMRLYVKHLENNIRLQPDIYLWSHKRWKHSWKEEYKKLWVDKIPPPQQ